MNQEQTRLDRTNPFLGLRPFSESEQDFFKGRKAEIEELLRYLKREVLTVLFGVSGLGKTSLLRAGLFPVARSHGYFPILIRLSFGEKEADGTEQIKAIVSAAIEKENVDAPAPEKGESLWNYFHRVQFWSARNDLLTPVLVFDQFEELFTLGQRSPGVMTLIGELACLIENRIPTAEQHSLAQVEELPFSIEQQNYRVILSLREDFLADLESLRNQIPSIGINRMRLLPMNGEASLQVVAQVPELIQKSVAEQVVRFVGAEAPDTPLADFSIEPALLSVFCRELNNKRLEQGDEQITVDLLKGSKEQILHDFYEKSVEHFDENVRRFIEEEMLTKTGYRNSVALEDALEQPGVTSEVISELINVRLVRSEERAGVRRIELTHDLLTGEIKASRDLRRNREAEEARKRAEVEAEKTLKKLRVSKAINVGFLAFLLISGIMGYVAYIKDREVTKQKDVITEAEGKVEEANTELASTVKKAIDVGKSVLDLRRLLKEGDQNIDPDELRRVSEAIFNANEAFYDKLVPTLLSEADSLMQAGMMVSEENARDALDSYQEVLLIDHRNLQALQGLDNVALIFRKQAEAKLKAGDFKDAARLADNGLLAGPGNEELQNLEKIRAVAISNLDERQQAIQSRLREAQELVQEGDFLLPPGANAKQKFEEVLKLDANNTQANRSLALLPDQVNREIQQLGKTEKFTQGLELADAAKQAYPEDDRFEVQAEYFEQQVNGLNQLLEKLDKLLKQPKLTVQTIEEAGPVFIKLVDDYSGEPAVQTERNRWIDRLKQGASIELIEQALRYFPESAALKNLQQQRLDEGRLAKLDTNYGQLEIVLLPWGKVLEIRDADNQLVQKPNISGTTPRVVSLAEGKYTVVVQSGNGDSGKKHEIETEVMAHQLSRITRNFSALNAVTYFERSSW